MTNNQMMNLFKSMLVNEVQLLKQIFSENMAYHIFHKRNNDISDYVTDAELELIFPKPAKYNYEEEEQRYLYNEFLRANFQSTPCAYTDN